MINVSHKIDTTTDWRATHTVSSSMSVISVETPSVAIVTSCATVGAAGCVINAFILVVLLVQQRKRKWNLVDRLITSQVTMDASLGACLLVIRVAMLGQ